MTLIIGLSDVSDAYQTAACLSTVVLDLPSDLFTTIVVPEKFGESGPWGSRSQALLDARDYGYAFLLLAHHLPTGNMSPRDRVTAALTAAGLPTSQEMRQRAAEEIALLDSSVREGDERERYLAFTSKGDELRTLRADEPTAVLAASLTLEDHANLPPMLLGDGGVRFQKGSGIAPYRDLVGWHEQAWTYFSKVEEFVGACFVD